MSDRMVRWGGVAAIVFVVLILITVFSGGAVPAADDAADKIRTYMVDHRSALLFSNVIGLIAIPFVIWFAVVLRDAARGDRMANALGTASLAGLLVTAPMALAGGAMMASAVFVDGAADKFSDDTVRIVFEAQTLFFTATTAGLVLFMLASALLIRRTGVLPAYTMWLALLGVVGNLVTMFSALSPGSASVLGFFGVLSFALFLLVSGITMALGKTTVSTAAL
jgi:hypothetical protein